MMKKRKKKKEEFWAFRQFHSSLFLSRAHIPWSWQSKRLKLAERAESGQNEE